MEGTPVDVPVPRKVSLMIESNVQCPMSNVKSDGRKRRHLMARLGIDGNWRWTLDLGLWTWVGRLAAGDIAAGIGASRFKRCCIGQGDILHPQVGKQALENLLFL